MDNGYILLVENNNNDVFFTRRAFEKAHISNRLEVVQTGPAALEWLLNSEIPLPSIVLLDLNLPMIDGITVLQRVRENERTKALPIVILTSSSEEQDLIKGYTAGVNSYVVKPIDFEQFCEAVNQLGMYWLVLNKQPTNDT